MINLSPAQIDVIDSVRRNRLTVVRAGPGSGKTRVFTEVLAEWLLRSGSKPAGVAALSFTNAARDVFKQRLGREPGHPHFMGTMDSFLMRYIVQPFGHLAGVRRDGAILVPDAVVRVIERPAFAYGREAWEKVSIFQADARAGDETVPVFEARDHHRAPIDFDRAAHEKILRLKRDEWSKRGRMNHSDVQFLASCVLSGSHGLSVLRMLCRRFPVVLIDEFQDTGWFLGRAIMKVLASVPTALVVGDPDQAIYQFGGADRQLFDHAEALPGAVRLTLQQSHRCPTRIAAVASALSRSGKIVQSAHGASGRAVLVVHEHADQDALIGAPLPVGASGRADATILIRRGRRGSSASTIADCPFDNAAPLRLHQAVEALRSGDMATAVRRTGRELSDLYFEDDVPSREDLERRGVSSRAWKASVGRVLLAAARVVPEETWNQWVVRLKDAIIREAVALQVPDVRARIGPRMRRAGGPGESRRVTSDLKSATAMGSNQALMTVHAAKGMEFDAVAYLIPKPNKKFAPCPSDTWWSNDVGSEEREIAYVACSRARNEFILAVHRKSFEAIKRERPDFVSLFEVIDPSSADGQLPSRE